MILRVLWCAAAIGVLAVMLWHWRPQDPEERDNPIVFAYLMMILTFPSGMLALYLAVVLPFAPDAPSRLFDYFIPWVLMTLSGYWQWFKVVPWLARKGSSALKSWQRR